MPLMSCAISELPTHVFLPIVQQQAHHLLEQLSLAEVIGNRIYITSDWSTHSKTSDDNNNAIPNNNDFRIEVNLQLNPSSQKWDAYTFTHTTAYGITARTLYESTPTYRDVENRVQVFEKRSPVTIVMNCDLSLMSADLAFEVPQKLFNQHDNGSVYEMNDLVYDYPVPKPIVSVLFGIWKMDRVKGEPAGVKFLDYLKRHTGTEGWHVHRNREIADEYEIVTPVYDLRTLASLEYSEDKPQGNMEGRFASAFTISFTYTLQFAMPTLNILRYPVVINNQLVDPRYIPIDKTLRHNRIKEYWHDRPTDWYMKEYQPVLDSFIQLPFYDDWKEGDGCAVKTHSLTPIAILAALRDEDKDTTTINLGEDLDKGISLSNLVKEILYQEGAEAVEYDTIYNVAVFRDEKQCLPNIDYTFDSDLNLTFKADEMSSHFHILVNVATKLTTINPKWWWLLWKYASLFPSQLRNQIIRRCNEGDWYDLFHLKNGQEVRADGWIYDKDGNRIKSLKDLVDEFAKGKYGYGYDSNGNLIPNGFHDNYGVNYNASRTNVRVVRSTIIAHGAAELETRNK